MNGKQHKGNYDSSIAVVTSNQCCFVSSSWLTQAPWVANLDSDVVLSKGMKPRDDHFTIWVIHCSSYCLVSGRGCIGVLYVTLTLEEVGAGVQETLLESEVIAWTDTRDGAVRANGKYDSVLE